MRRFFSGKWIRGHKAVKIHCLGQGNGARRKSIPRNEVYFSGPCNLKPAPLTGRRETWKPLVKRLLTSDFRLVLSCF